MHEVSEFRQDIEQYPFGNNEHFDKDVRWCSKGREQVKLYKQV